MPQLTIDRLALHMPSTDPVQVRRLAVAVAERLAAYPLASSGDLGQLKINVPWPDGTTDDRLADAISNAILQAIDHETEQGA